MPSRFHRSDAVANSAGNGFFVDDSGGRCRGSRSRRRVGRLWIRGRGWIAIGIGDIFGRAADAIRRGTRKHGQHLAHRVDALLRVLVQRAGDHGAERLFETREVGLGGQVFISTSPTLSPSKGTRPVTISYSMMPSA